MADSEPIRAPRASSATLDPGLAFASSHAMARRAVAAPAARLSAALCAIHFDAYLHCLDDFEMKFGDCYYYINMFNQCRQRANASA